MAGILQRVFRLAYPDPQERRSDGTTTTNTFAAGDGVHGVHGIIRPSIAVKLGQHVREVGDDSRPVRPAVLYRACAPAGGRHGGGHSAAVLDAAVAVAVPRICLDQCPTAQNRCQALLALRPLPAAAGAHIVLRLDHHRLPRLGGGEVHRLGGAGTGLLGFAGDSVAHQAAAVETHGDGSGGDLYGCFSGRHGAVGRRAMARGGHQALLRPPDVP